MRDVHLTSPAMRGLDIQHLQQALNARLRARGESAYQVALDGVYGPATAHAVALAAYDLGLHHYDGTSAVTRLIEHPALRNPAELLEAKKRAAHRPPSTGLASVPVIAAKYIGVHEDPPSSNKGNPEPSGWEKHFFGYDGLEWCGCFAGNMVIAAGGMVTSRVAYCPSIKADAESRMNGFDAWTTNPAAAGPGWLVLYCWDGSGTPEHVGIVESIHPDHLVAIEGNAGGTDPAWGGMVGREQRTFNFVVGFARPRL